MSTKKKDKIAKLFNSAKVQGAIALQVCKLAGTPCSEVVDNGGNKESRVQLVFMAVGASGLGRNAMPAFTNLAGSLMSTGKANGVVKNVNAAKADKVSIGTEYSEPQRYGHAVDGKVGTQKYCAGHVDQCKAAIAKYRSNADLGKAVVAAFNSRLAELKIDFANGEFATTKPLTAKAFKLHVDAIEKAIA